MTNEVPAKNRRPWSWAQFGIAIGLIPVCFLCFHLGVNAGFGGSTGFGIVDRLVWDGEVFFVASFFIAGAGAVWV